MDRTTPVNDNQVWAFVKRFVGRLLRPLVSPFARPFIEPSVALTLSTLNAYAKIVGVVVGERLWRLPDRQARATVRCASDVGRRMP